jgi:hypothetical protein
MGYDDVWCGSSQHTRLDHIREVYHYRLGCTVTLSGNKLRLHLPVIPQNAWNVFLIYYLHEQ